MRSNCRELKKRAWAANLEIARRGLAIYTFGNASAFDREAGLVAIKPSGVAYEDLSVEDIVVLDLEGKIVEGRLRPSSDTRTHLVLFREMPGLGGVVHTHSTYATGWAQAASPIPILGTTHADYLAEDVPCTPVMSAAAAAGDYEAETGRQILDCFRGRDPSRTPMVLVAGHGAFTWGKRPRRRSTTPWSWRRSPGWRSSHAPSRRARRASPSTSSGSTSRGNMAPTPTTGRGRRAGHPVRSALAAGLARPAAKGRGGMEGPRRSKRMHGEPSGRHGRPGVRDASFCHQAFPRVRRGI